MKRFMLSVTEEMDRALERERKRRMLDSIPETVRMILSEHLAQTYAKRRQIEKAIEEIGK